MAIIDEIDTPTIKSLSFDTSLDCSNFIKKYALNDLIIAHFNIRSITKNYDNLTAFISIFPVKIDVIVCSETRVINDQDFFNITGYDLLYSGSTFNQNDGTLIYINNNLKSKHKLVKIDKCKAIELSITHPNQDDICIFAMYRPPSTDIDQFINSLTEYLNDIRQSSSTFLIVGDINIDLFSNNQKAITYKNLLESEGFISAINNPTHVVGSSHTAIDHIYIRKNISLDNINGMTINNSFTDHYPILINLPNIHYNMTIGSNENIFNTSYKLVREQLVDSVSNDKWDVIFQGDDPQSMTDRFISRFNKHIFAATVLLDKPNNRTNNVPKIKKPWINKFIFNLIIKKEKLYLLHRKNINNTVIESEYKTLKNKLTDIIKKAKNDYYNKLIKNSSDNPRKLWSNINMAVNNKNKKQTIIDKLIDNDSNTTVENEGEIANCLNNYYSKIGENLASNFNITEYPNIPNLVPDTCMLYPTDEIEILEVINNLKPSNTTGPDGISTNVIKCCGRLIAKYISKLINLIFLKSIIPTSFKIEHITPVYKSGEKSECQNFRPLSKTSTLAKIFEKSVVRRIEKFCIKFNIISNNQFAYKKKTSVEDAISSVTSKIHDLLATNKKILVVGLDLAKAFNSINHQLLLDKLETYGIRGNTRKLIADYLNNRTQYVKYQNTLSNKTSYKFGVPQGTVLGPLLFNLYLNDLFNIETHGDIFAYADDTTVIYSDDSWDSVYKKAAYDLGNLFKWFYDNWLTINFRKSCFIPIGPYQDSLPLYKQIIITSNYNNISNVKIERRDELKLLGVVFDCNLKWKNHLQLLSKKLNRVIYIIIKLKQIIDFKLLKIVYFALFQSLLNYGIIAWGSAYENVLSPVQRQQNKALKILFSKNRLFSTAQLYSEIDIPNIRNTYIVQAIFKFAEKLGINRTCNITTRAVSHRTMIVPKYKNALSMRSAKYVGTSAYNLICTRISQTRNYNKKSKKKLLTEWVKNDRISDKLRL